MTKINDFTNLAIVAGAGYLIYKFKNPLESVAKVVDKTADIASNTLDYGAGAFIDLTGGDSQNPYKTAVQNSAKSAVSGTTTAYDWVRNNAELTRDRLANLFREDQLSTLDRYQSSSNNTKFVGDPQVRTTLIYDKNENITGSYNNLLGASLTAEATKLVESSGENAITRIKTSSSSSSRSRSSSSSKKSISSILKLNSTKNYTPVRISTNKDATIRNYENKNLVSTSKTASEIKSETTIKKLLFG